MKKIMFSLFALMLLSFNLSSAKADPTYAVLDSNGNVTNVIVCGSACASGEFGGNKVVLQVAADPVTNENRGSFWQGPGTTTYNENTGVFRVSSPPVVVTNTVNEEEDGSVVVSSATTSSGSNVVEFTYNDTIGDNLFVRSGFIENRSQTSPATVSVTKDNVTETLDFNDRKTQNEIQESVSNSGLVLLNSKVQTLISLLGSWVK